MHTFLSPALHRSELRLAAPKLAARRAPKCVRWHRAVEALRLGPCYAMELCTGAQRIHLQGQAEAGPACVNQAISSGLPLLCNAQWRKQSTPFALSVLAELGNLRTFFLMANCAHCSFAFPHRSRGPWAASPPPTHKQLFRLGHASWWATHIADCVGTSSDCQPYQSSRQLRHCSCRQREARGCHTAELQCAKNARRTRERALRSPTTACASTPPPGALLKTTPH